MNLNGQETRPAPSYCEIQLTKGYIATVSVSDREKAFRYKWKVYIDRRKDGTIKTVYAVRRPRVGKRSKLMLLHRYLLDITDPKVDVDHIDHNGLNCQRENLRIATRSQNNGNARKALNKSSTYKGVSWSKDKRKWCVKINPNGKTMFLGYFNLEDEELGALVYDEAAKVYFGEFACLNFPDD